MDDEYTHVCADCGLGVPDEDDLPECGTSETYEASQWEEDAMAPDGGCD
jgi:hypothetical protein